MAKYRIATIDKGIMKRLLISTVMLLCPLLTFAQFSGTVYDSQGVGYTANNDGSTCYVSGHENSYSATITIPEVYEGRQVTSIVNGVFAYCTSLKSLTIPSSVTSIGENPFQYCIGLTSIIVDGGNTVYDSRDNCNAIIKTSDNTLIAGCKNTVIPSSVTSIGGSAFRSCSGLASIPSSVMSIGNYAFYDCSGLTSLTIPSSVTSIGDYAFKSCSGLTSLSIPSSVTSIGSFAFFGCSGLTSVIVGWERPLEIISNTFTNSNYQNATLYVPKGTKAAYEAAAVWQDFGNIVDEPYVEGPITGIINWGNRKNPNYWYAKDDYRERSGFIELHAYVYAVEDEKEPTGQTTKLQETIADAFIDNKIVNLTSDADKDAFVTLTNGGGYTGKDIDFRLEFVNGALKTFKGIYTDGKVYQFFPRISADGLTLSFVRDLNGNGIDDDADDEQVVAKLVYTDMANQDINHLRVEYQKSDYAKALLNYLPHQELNDDVLTVYVAVKGKIGDSEIEFSGNHINIRFLRPINVKENETEVEDTCVNDQQVIYLRDIVKFDDWRDEPFKANSNYNYWFYYGVTDIEIVDVAAGANLATNNDILTNLSLDSEAAPTKPLSEVSDLIELQYNPQSWVPVANQAPEQGDFGTLTYTKSNPLIKKFILQLPVRVKYIWGEVYSTIQVKVVNSAYLEDDDVFRAKTPEGIDMKFKVISAQNRTCQVGNGERAAISNNTQGTITIPNTIIGYSVTSIGDRAFLLCSNLTSVIIPNSVTSIGELAFRSCYVLSSITIGNSVRNIGAGAFGRCGLRSLFCYADDVPSTGTNVFFMSNVNLATLHVPATALDAYKTTAPWSGFGNIVAIEDDDLQYYLNSLDDSEDTFTDNVYQRKFKNGDWQSLYVPFAMNYNDWSDWFEVASIDEIAQYDDNNDGLTDRQEVKCTMIESGSTEANQPYFIRAKKKDGATLSVDVSQQNQLAVSKTFTAGQTTYTITGNYTQLSGMKTAGQYRMKGGSLWIPTSDTEVLPPYRWYLIISGESPVSGARLAVTTNQEGVTAINEKMKTGNGDDGRLYDLQGRRIKTPYHTGKGLYIKDGKKYVVK